LPEKIQKISKFFFSYCLRLNDEVIRLQGEGFGQTSGLFLLSMRGNKLYIIDYSVSKPLKLVRRASSPSARANFQRELNTDFWDFSILIIQI
jgi:hypothetical protein